MRNLKVAALAFCTWVLLAIPGFGQSLPRLTPLGFCTLGSVASAVGVTTTNCVFVSFTGVIAGTTLTTSAQTGYLLPGQRLVGSGLSTTNPPTILAQLTGTAGAAGTYRISSSLTVASEAMTAAGIPPVAGYALICSTTQAVNYRDDGATPTGTAGSGGQPIPAGSCIGFNGSFTLLQIIQQAATAVVGVSFYK